MESMLPHQVEELLVIGMVGVLVISTLYFIFAVMRRKQQNDMQRHMLEKFVSTNEFAEFVQSPAGQNYVMNLSELATNPNGAILGSVRMGVVLVFAGGGLAATISSIPHNPYFWVLGLVIACVGFGFLVSAAISYWLAKKIAREAKE